MPELHGSWQRGGDLGVDWFFQTLPRDSSPSHILLHSMEIGSDFCNKVVSKVQSNGFVPEIVLNSKNFALANGSEELLQKGVHITLLFYDSLGPEEIMRITQVEKYSGQLKFVIVARRDWNVSNTFRSLPHFVRDRLYVDFPVPLHPSDPFLARHESRRFLSAFEKDFPGYQVKPYCPHLFLYSEGRGSNIESIELPEFRKGVNPELSLICCDSNSLNSVSEWIKSSQFLPETFEVLFVSPENYDHKVVSVFKSQSFLPFHVKKKSFNLNVPKTFLKNFAIQKCQSQNIVFCDGLTVAELETGLASRSLVYDKVDLLTVGGFDPLIQNKDLQQIDFSYRKSLSRGEIPDIRVDFHSIDYAEDQSRYFSEKDLFSHKHLNWHAEKTEISEQSDKEVGKSLEEHYRRIDRRRHYLSLFKQSPKVPLEAFWRVFKMPFLWLYDLLIRNVWRVRPSSYKLYWFLREKLLAVKDFFNLTSYDWYWKARAQLNPLNHKWFWALRRSLNPRSYEIYWYFRRVLDLKSYGWYWTTRTKLSPLSHEWYWVLKALVNPRTYQVYWSLHKKLNPRTYSWYWILLERSIRKYWRLRRSLNPRSHFWYWNIVKFFSKVRHCIVVNLWRVGPRQVYWYFFRVLFPVRKVYYFLSFQYEKRILGLHRKSLSEQGRS